LIIVHLIIAHNYPSPNNLVRIVDLLKYKDDLIYIHVDLKFDVNEFKNIFVNHTNVRFIKKRVKVYWAAFSMIEATVNSFKEIIEEVPNFSFLNLLSGQDYLLKPISSFHDFLNANKGKAFMHSLDINTEWTEAKSRVAQYHLTNFKFLGKYQLQNILNFILPERKIPENITIVGRSQWFTISKKHVEYIIAKIAKNPDLVRFFKFTWAPDEFFFQTILFNSIYKEDIINNNLRFIDWSEGKKNPKVFTSNDFNLLIESNQFFARKFDVNVDAKILDLIDQKRNS